jgi:hypothetical protein
MHRTLGTAALWAAFMYMAALTRATPFPDNQLQQVFNTSSLNRTPLNISLSMTYALAKVLVSGCPFVEDGASEGSGSLILPERYNDPSSPLVTRTASTFTKLLGVLLTSGQISYIPVPTKDAVNGCVYHVKDEWPCPADRPVIAKTIRNPGSIPLYQIKDEIEGLQKVNRIIISLKPCYSTHFPITLDQTALYSGRNAIHVVLEEGFHGDAPHPGRFSSCFE